MTMNKMNNRIYWIATGLLAFGMAAQGVAQLAHTQGYVDILVHLGYPLYFLSILGVWKLLGVLAILLPRFALVKEWAYAGFFFVMTGAIVSHIALGDSVLDALPASVLLLLIGLSWYFRPVDRSISFSTQSLTPTR